MVRPARALRSAACAVCSTSDDDFPAVAFHVNGSTTVRGTRSARDTSTVLESASVRGKDADDRPGITANGDFLRDALKTIGATRALLHWNDRTSPMVLEDAENGGPSTRRAIIMPITVDV